MQAYGTQIVAGVTPGKGGQQALDGTVPVFDTVSEAIRETGANTSCIFVPAGGAPDAVMEAAGGGDRHDLLHHRGHPDARHDRRGRGRPAGRRDA